MCCSAYQDVCHVHGASPGPRRLARHDAGAAPASAQGWEQTPDPLTSHNAKTRQNEMCFCADDSSVQRTEGCPHPETTSTPRHHRYNTSYQS